MNLDDIPITFITPCFCRGADCSKNGAPEIRPPSIRGQLHWWFRALGGSWTDENAIFGNVHGGATASKVIIRVRAPLAPQTQSSPTLPHKQGGPSAAPKKAIAAGSTFNLLVSWRLNPASAQKKAFDRALDAWLLLGALGLRATRGSGNFSCEKKQPATPETYAATIAGITVNTRLRAALLNKTYTTAEAARRDITDTLSHQAFAHERFPLGAVRQGPRDQSGAPSRKTSPLRLRVVKFAAAATATFQIAAIWDGRQAVTGNTHDNLQAAIHQLATANKPIGHQLANSPLAQPA
jgi:CRISPR type III-B/RAMP module RAMP protein Cmr1